MRRFPRILPLGDCALVIEFGDRIAPKIHQLVLDGLSALEQHPFPGRLDIVPTYRSLTVYFDPTITDVDSLTAILLRLARNPGAARPRSLQSVTVPVLYSPDVAPDLQTVATEAGVTIEEVISLHTSVAYRVYMLGFMPGFPYLGLVSRRIAVPRLATPRKLVRAGSVGIAGNQTGIYPRDSPGGWRIIGRTPVQVFDLRRAQPCLLEPGNEVRFVAIERDEYEEISKMNQ